MKFLSHFLMKIQLFLLLLVMSEMGLAQTIIIQPNTIIAQSQTYNNVTLDMSNGNFIVRNNATLTIKNSIVNGTLSSTNPVLIQISNAKLILMNNQVNIQSGSITPHPYTQSVDYFIKIGATGGINLTGNTFSIDTPFTAGLLITTSTILTSGFNIITNVFKGFHGVLYLINSNNSTIRGNQFFTNSYGHIVINGKGGTIEKNKIFFAGNNKLGNSIDILDGENININDNILSTPTCHGIYMINSSNIAINQNRIAGGITYAIMALTNPEIANTKDRYLAPLLTKYKFNHLTSSNITITNNYMSQNRYGVAASDVNGLTVSNNIFIQRFSNAAARKFWTDNNTLFKNVSNLTWSNNLYKEAFTQINGGDNSQSLQFVNFPSSGGVSL